MRALLIIDMQVGSFKPETPCYDANGVVHRINSLSNYFRQNRDKVIFIQHDGTKENYYIPGTSDWHILPTLIQHTNDIIIGKTANDSFYHTDLETVLKNNDITDLFITGFATDYCVNATVHSALIKDYNIFIVEDCHTTKNRNYLTAEQVIQYHNWLWENLTPTNGKVKLVLSKDLIITQDAT